MLSSIEVQHSILLNTRACAVSSRCCKYHMGFELGYCPREMVERDERQKPPILFQLMRVPKRYYFRGFESVHMFSWRCTYVCTRRMRCLPRPFCSIPTQVGRALLVVLGDWAIIIYILDEEDRELTELVWFASFHPWVEEENGRRLYLRSSESLSRPRFSIPLHPQEVGDYWRSYKVNYGCWTSWISTANQTDSLWNRDLHINVRTYTRLFSALSSLTLHRSMRCDHHDPFCGTTSKICANVVVNPSPHISMSLSKSAKRF